MLSPYHIIETIARSMIRLPHPSMAGFSLIITSFTEFLDLEVYINSIGFDNAMKIGRVAAKRLRLCSHAS